MRLREWRSTCSRKVIAASCGMSTYISYENRNEGGRREGEIGLGKRR